MEVKYYSIPIIDQRTISILRKWKSSAFGSTVSADALKTSAEDTNLYAV